MVALLRLDGRLSAWLSKNDVEEVVAIWDDEDDDVLKGSNGEDAVLDVMARLGEAYFEEGRGG